MNIEELESKHFNVPELDCINTILHTNISIQFAISVLEEIRSLLLIKDVYSFINDSEKPINWSKGYLTCNEDVILELDNKIQELKEQLK